MTLLTHWRLILEIAAVAILSIMLASAKADVRHFKKLYESSETARKLEHAEVRRVRAEQKAADAQHVLNIKKAEEKVSSNVSADYQARLSELRARYDRLRAGAPQTVAGRSGGEDLPSVSQPPGGSNGPATSGLMSGFNCEANSLQLGALQQWIRDQLAIER